MGHDAFISFCNQERRIADACVKLLEDRGWTCWISHRDIVPGTDYGEAIIDAINEARSLVLIFSKAADESPHVLREVERAVNRRMPVITFRVEDLAPRKALEYFLSSPHWLDAWTEPPEPHLERLDGTLEALLGPVTPPEAEPVTPPLEPTPLPAAQLEREACPGCDEENPARAVFCPHCGIALIETCGGCGEDGRTALPFCASCGANKPAYEKATTMLRQAREALAAHRYEAALEAASDGLEHGELEDDLRSAAEQARIRLTALNDFRPEFERLLQAADLEGASSLIEQAEELKPTDDRFEEARERLATARRDHEIREILDKARADLDVDRQFERTLAGCARVLEMSPGHAEAQALHDRATKIRADYAERMAAVDSRLEQGAWERALSTLNGLSDAFPWSDEVGRRREAVSRLQRRDTRYRDLKEKLPALLEAEKWKVARKALDQILDLRPDDGEAQAQREALKRRPVAKRTSLRVLLTVVVGVVVGLSVVLAFDLTGDRGEGESGGGSTVAGSAPPDPSAVERDSATRPTPRDAGSRALPAPPQPAEERAAPPEAREADPPAAQPVVIPTTIPAPEEPPERPPEKPVGRPAAQGPEKSPGIPEARVAPDLLGWTLSRAEAWCRESGQLVTIREASTSDPDASGTIVDQDPPAGARLARSDFFTLTVGVLEASAPPAPTVPSPDVPAIGDVVPDYELMTVADRTLHLSDLNTTHEEVRGLVLEFARAFGAESPTLATRFSALPLLEGESDDVDPDAVHRFVAGIGRFYALMPTREASRAMRTLDEILQWILSHVRDPIVIMPWSSRCFLCEKIDPELRVLFAASGARFIALGGAYGDSREDLERLEEESPPAYLLVDDSSHRISDALDLHRTCNFVVLDADLKMHYRGVLREGHQQAIGGDEEAAWLADALEAVKKGEACFVPRRTGYG